MHSPWIDDYLLFEKYILESLGPRPEGMSIDRINNDGNYEPGNLRWATKSLQVRNRRNNVLTPDLVIYIRKQRDAGVRQCDVIRELGLHRRAVQRVWHNTAWKDIA